MIDTPAKRASLIGYGLPFRLALPIPDGTIGQGDRQHLVGLYSGILAAAPIIVTAPFSIVWAGRIVTQIVWTGQTVTSIEW